MGSALTKRIACTLGAGILLFAACGDDDDSADEGTTDTTAEEREVIKVCSDTPYPPFEFEDEDSGEQTGFDIELLRAVADQADKDIEVIDTEFDGIVLAPQAGQCDMVASALTITPERQEQALFSDPYYDADQSLLVLADNEDTYATLDGLAGKTIGVQSTTTGETYANENKPDGATIQSFPDSDAMFLALESGEVDALLQDLPVNAYRAEQDSNFVVTDTFPTGEQYGYLAAKDNQALIDEINEGLAAVRDDGTYDDLYAEWFPAAPQS
jgi:polar amino acid transport system substrate-binding protein